MSYVERMSPMYPISLLELQQLSKEHTAAREGLKLIARYVLQDKLFEDPYSTRKRICDSYNQDF